MEPKFKTNYSPNHLHPNHIQQQHYLQIHQEPLHISSITPRNKLNSLSSYPSPKSQQLKQLLVAHRSSEEEQTSRKGKVDSENRPMNFSEMQIVQMEEAIQRLREMVQERDLNIYALQQHNHNMMVQIKAVSVKMETTINQYEEELDRKYQKIQRIERQLMEKEGQIRYLQEGKGRQEQLCHRIQDLKNANSQDYNQLLLIKGKQINSLQDKVKELKDTNHQHNAQKDVQMYELTKENKYCKQRIQQLQHYLQIKEQTMKKMSNNHDQLVLQNQVLKQNKLQAQIVNTNTKHNKELLDIKSKYQLLHEMNTKLQIQLQSILKEAQQIRNRQTMLQMQVQQLQAQVRQLKEHREHVLNTTTQYDRSVGKIKTRKVSNNNISVNNGYMSMSMNNKVFTPKSTLVRVQEKMKMHIAQIQQQQQQIKSLQQKNKKRDKIDELVIRELKNKVQSIIKEVRNAEIQQTQNALFQLLSILDKVPLNRANYLRNGCQNCDILNIPQLSQTNIIKKLQQFHQQQQQQQGKHNHENGKVKVRKPILQIQIEDDSRFERELCEQLLTGNTQYDSYFKNEQ